VGIGLRAPHVGEILASLPRIAWLEVHAENYMGGGPARRALERIRPHYPLALHGVGLSLGTAGGLDVAHLRRLRRLVGDLEPAVVSEHLAWSSTGGVYLNHLLPLPCTEETLHVVCDNLGRAQDALGRAILLENPSSYLRFSHSTIPEPDFLGETVRRTGCGLLCDVNNIHVSAHNLGFDTGAYLDALPAAAVGEIHLAGHSANDADGRTILIDDHGARVAPEVWRLYARAITRFGPRPTLIEWDTEIPALDVLLDEAGRAERVTAVVGHGETVGVIAR
jgi:uncharacterized protein (UPF0276 family)